MRESRTYGSVRGALSNERPYRDRQRNAGATAQLVRWSRISLALHPGYELRRCQLFPLPHINKMPGDRRCRRHRGRHEMGAALVALAAFEVAVRGRGAALARCELVGIHRKAHGAARLAPFEAGLDEDLVEAFGLGLLLHQP